MRGIWHFIKEYKLFVGGLIAAAIGLALDISGHDGAAHWLLGIVALIEVLPLLWGMYEDLRQGTYGVDILAATAIIVSVVMHEYWAAIVIVLMLTGGESLEDYAERRASRELNALLERAPQIAHVWRKKQLVDVRASEVAVGDKIVVRPGEVVPVDARIVEGAASFDESSLTGESLPQVREDGQQILSGSVNLDGAVTAEALHDAADSQYEQIIKLVRAASNSKAPFVRLADRYSVPFTIISFGIAFAAWAISGQSIRFLEVLVVATPCPLILAAPIAIISGMSRASKHGIIIKTGSSLEKLAQAKTFAFDKTGTLTEGKPVVSEVKTFNTFTRDEVLSVAAALEKNSNHVLAQAIVARAKKGQVKLAKVKQVKEIAGNGLIAVVNGRQTLVGRMSLLEQHNVELPKNFKQEMLAQTAALVAIDGQLAGVIICQDQVRAESKSTIKRLKDLGVQKFLMVTGDNKTTAQAIAKQVGVRQVVAEALPGDKIGAIESIVERPVAFVGDGVNDAPVLTASDLGIALGARGSTAASESADVVIMTDDLGQVAMAKLIAKRTLYIARQSILVGIALSIVLMFIFATGHFKPVYGAAIQELVDVVVIFNALRAHTEIKNK